MFYYHLVEFYLEDCVAKKRKRGPYMYHVNRVDKKLAGNVLLIRHLVYLPRYYRKKEEWTIERKNAYLRGLHLPEEDAYCHYRMEPEKSLSFAWGKLLVRLFTNNLKTMVFLQNRKVCDSLNTELMEWIAAYATQIHDFYVVTKDYESVEGLRQWAMEEYGISLRVVDFLKKIDFSKNPKSIVIAQGEWQGTALTSLSEADYFLPLIQTGNEKLQRYLQNYGKTTEKVRTLGICNLIQP